MLAILLKIDAGRMRLAPGGGWGKLQTNQKLALDPKSLAVVLGGNSYIPFYVPCSGGHLSKMAQIPFRYSLRRNPYFLANRAIFSSRSSSFIGQIRSKSSSRIMQCLHSPCIRSSICFASLSISVYMLGWAV